MRQMIFVLAVVVPALLGAVPAAATSPAADAEASDSPGAAQETVSSDDITQLAARYYEEGLQAHIDGKLKLAHTLLKAAVRLDPEHKRAEALLGTIEDKLGISEADKLREKLEARILEVKFERASVEEVLRFLSREGDINIVFDASALATLGSGQPAGQEGAEAVDEAEAGGEEAEPGFVEADSAPAERPRLARRDLVTLHLKNVPLKEVLKYVLRFKALKYIVEDYAIVIVPTDWVDRSDMITEVFYLTTSGLGPSQAVDTLRQRSESW
jgi:hypothetical protein